MSLAEPRKRRKNAIQSINLSAPNHWTNDDSKFGQRMLEKFGWSKGSGLGKNKQGISENIRVEHKVHPTGLGFIANNADDWFKAGEDYSRLLSQLTEKFDQYQALSESNSSSKKSLVQNSLNSRSRVHYHKFTKGKDLTQYKSEELACILGKGVKDDDESSNGLNMKEYFESKKERKKLQIDKHDTSSSSGGCTIIDDNNMQEETAIKGESETEEHEINTMLLKKNKRRAKQLKDTELIPTNSDEIQLKKKKKKTKELICEKIDDIELSKKKTKKNKLSINENLDEVSKEDDYKTIVKNDDVEEDSEMVLTHKYQNLVDLLIENSSAGTKFCKDSPNPLFLKSMKEFADSVAAHQCSTTVGSTEVKLLSKKETSLKPITLNPDAENFIKDFEEQKSKNLEIISKRQELAKYVNDKSMFIANHGDVLFFGSNINDIKGYGEW